MNAFVVNKMSVGATSLFAVSLAMYQTLTVMDLSHKAIDTGTSFIYLPGTIADMLYSKA
jgi:hypothetical protein